MLIDEFLCKREVLGKRAPHSFTPPSKCGRCVQQVVTLSLIRIFGHPNLVMMSSNMNRATVVTLQSLTAIASTYLVKYSITVIMYLDHVRFPGGFIGPTKSMAHF
jgi:hypothetical protein